MIRLGPNRLVSCRCCGSWVYLPRLRARDQAALHDTPDYFEHPYFKQRRQAEAAAERRAKHVMRAIAEVVDVSALRGGRYLDVGCDTGLFAAAIARELDVVPFGIDVAGRAVDESRRRGIEAYQADLSEAPDTLGDLTMMTAIDLIEHVSSPPDFLAEARRRLRPGGLLYFETPNLRSLVYQTGRALGTLTGARPRAMFQRLFPPQHAQYFTDRGMADLAERCGFEALRVEKAPLSAETLVASPMVRIAVRILQLADRVIGEPILLRGLLRRP